jgi:hypothetical protein
MLRSLPWNHRIFGKGFFRSWSFSAERRAILAILAGDIGPRCRCEFERVYGDIIGQPN